METESGFLNPQQEAFLKCYLDPQSPTWGNATQSAITAGYSKDYADNIMALMPKWLKSVLSDNKLVDKALDNLSDFIGNKENVNIQWDATKFVLTTLGKNKFSSRTENVVTFENEETKQKADKLIGDYLGNKEADRN